MTTTNPVPSSDVSDLLFNAQKLDEVVNSELPEYTDRLGVLRQTAAGATASIRAFNSRGAWVTATLYQIRDLVIVSGVWYACVAVHTSGATFAGDVANWRVHQGLTREEAADTASASNGGGRIANNATLNYAAGTLGAKALERVSICDYPWLAVGDGAMTTDAGRPIGAGTGTNNAAAIQAAHDWIVASGKRRVLEIPYGIFRCDTGLKINAEFVTLHFLGGILDFRNIGNTAGIQVYSTAQYQKQTLWCTGSGAIAGPVGTVSTTSKGLFYESNHGGGPGTADISLTEASGLSVYHFAESVQVGFNAYICGHNSCHFWFSSRFYNCPSGLTNAGQKWAFFNCSFVNGTNGFYTNEPTANVELHSCDILPTGGYAFAPESGYIAMFGGGIEVDGSVGSQLIKNTNAGGGTKSTFISVGANFLWKNSTTQPFIDLGSLNTHVKLIGGHASVAAGSVFFSGTGSGSLSFDNVLCDGDLDLANSGTVGAGFSLSRSNQPFSGNSTQTGTHQAAGLLSRPAAGGSVAALSGASVNTVSITGTYTTLLTSTGCFLIIIRDNTVGGCAVKIYDSGSGVIGSLYDNIGATVQFQHTGTAFQARTTAGTATRTMIILAIKV